MEILMYFIIIVVLLLCIKIYSILTMGRCTSKKKLHGKTILVTGANRGIGFYTAKDFAIRGARVIITSENKEDCHRARDKIIKETGNKNIIAKYLDFTSLEVTRAFAKDILDTEDRLDILVNNAGTVGLGSILTKDGLLPGLQVNYFGPFLLTNLLLGLLKKSAPSRIVNVASVLSQCGIIDSSNINSCPGPVFSNTVIYSNSKLLVVYMTYELAERLKGKGITVNCLHPGAVSTQIYQVGSRWHNLILTLFGPFFFKSGNQGAQTSIHLAVSDNVEGITGEYFSDCRIAKHLIPKNDSVIKEVWANSVALVKLKKEEMHV